MLNQVQNMAWETAKSTAGIMLYNLSGAPDMLRNAVPSDLKLATYAVDGLGYALVGEGVDWMTGNTSTIVDGDWYGYIDNVAFMGVVAGISNESGLVTFAFNQIKNVSPLDFKMNLAITEGLVISSGRAVGDLIDNMPNVPSQLKLLRHPTRLMQ
jgi:hypothetical protein